MDSALIRDEQVDVLLVPTEFSRCKIYIKCGEHSLYFGRKLGYDINNECEVVLGLGSSKFTHEIDSLLQRMKTGDTSPLTLLDEHNISHVIDITLVSFDPAPRINGLNLSEITERARALKERGTVAFQEKELETAFYLYSRALKYLCCALMTMKINQLNDDIQKEDICRLKCSCHLNLAACQLMGTNTKGVIKNCTVVLEAEPNNIKALFRRSQAYSKLQEYEQAINDLKRASEIDPRNRSVINALAEAKKSLRNESLIMSERLKGIFG